ncbi:glycosyltransferase [Iodobacter sp. HSC-16F04]|uniref:Glycosyltransferase n=1 Tax=Iodobacter violaceini TaxID=3044271 RepID=A0ABX0KNT7_9NEIS|nr:glycosyltransferase [Iodobacter violacea]NHQ85975.1 glycosyltransferase [Iodobacter violacea]
MHKKTHGFTNNLPRFAVLLASFNGMKYIENQIDSIVKQVCVDVTIFVSDDFSIDGTWEWLQNNRSQNIKLLSRTTKFGSAGANFFRLINDVSLEKFDYVAFCDQDDIWFEDKLIRAVNAIEEYSCNAYSSNVTAFWPDGNEVLINKAQPLKKWDYFFEAAGPGCTYVLQSNVVKMLAQAINKNLAAVKRIELHDWLIYAWIRSHNLKWFIDPVPSMNYRQHSNNVVGVNNGVAAAKVRLAKMLNGWYSKQILLIASVIDMADSQPACWIRNPTFMNKIKLLKSTSSCRRRFRDQLAFLVYVIAL